uniref:complement receptor type 2-like isoform X2 n=1 Tax=Podarcis muralis TaxID=64176 RepID=UPI00109EFDA3|nr:complement receptor type 2-like isoform X2 [Podarcis muralis]
MMLACMLPLLWGLMELLAITLDDQGGCGPPPRLNFAELTDEYKQKNLFPVGSIVKYMCRPGYTGLRYSIKCLQSQEWSKVLERCKRQSCGNPGEPDNGKLIVPQDILFGSTVNYTCNEGHRLIGSTSSRKCVVFGRKVGWTNDIPLCQRIPCFPPPDVPHGKHSGRSMNDFSYGTAVSYTCDKGHPLVGNATIYCTTKDGLNGIWSGRAYCGVAHCPAPQIENGRIVTGYSVTYTYNQRVTLDCNAGHKIVGSREIHCQVDGTWDPPLPHCEQVTGCENPEIQNGRITRSRGQVKPKETITFECDPGYILKGNHTIQCQFDSMWDSPVPICVRVIQCQPPPHVQNGMYNQEAAVFTNGMSVKYTCEPGYGLIGEGTIYCTASGTWSSPAPRCEEGSCAPPPSLQFAELLNEYKENNSFPVGSVVKYMCRPGYAKHPGLKASLMCIRNQEWSGVQEFCKRKSCGYPGEPDNGRLIVTKDLLFGSTINYTCEEGYRLVGLSSRQCVISGLKAVWTGETAICQPISCSPPPDVPHGKHSGIDDYFYGTAVSYTCEKSHPLVGNATIYCTTKDGVNGVWSGRAYCGVTRCPAPQVRNGRIVTGYSDTYTYNQRVTLDCNAGYKISGTREIHCQVDGTWDPPLPHCELVSQCPLPLDIPNGNHNGFPGEVFTSQKSVTYSCDPGYSLVGKASISCTASGEWSSPLPRCERQCPPPQVVAHGKYSSQEAKGFTNGGFVEYTCDPGYSIIGDARIFCTASGSWNSSAPNCKVTGCVSPKIQNGRITRSKGQVKPTETITFECDPGYILKGNHTIQCQFDSTWDSPTPICVRETRCQPPAKIENGNHSHHELSVFTSGMSVNYTCEPGYFLTGRANVHCTASGTWSSSAPQCKKLQCPPPLPIPNGDHNGHGEAHFATGRYVNYTCDRGYLLRGKASSQCTASGAWSQPLPQCEVMHCPPPPSIAHGKNIGEDLTYGSSVIYICDAGYSLEGEYLVTCILEGSNSVNWTKLPKCKGCPAPQVIANGERDSESLEDFPYGSSVTYRCDPDYFLTGAATIHCLSSGTWDQSVPHCKSRQHSTSIPLSEIQCQQPTKIQNGDHSHQELSVFTSGMSVNYTCEPGYSLRGEATIYCTPSGKWSAPAPHCKKIQCRPPPSIQNGIHSNEGSSVFTNGMFVKYTCEPGYSLTGEGTIYCTTSGTWSAPAPHCEELQCPPPLPIPNGDHNGHGEAHFATGRYVNYTCDRGYLLRGKASSQCTASGAWSQPLPQCEVMHCPPPPSIAHGKNIGEDLTYGSSVIYICDAGYSLEGEYLVTCILEGSSSVNWTKLPKCKGCPAPQVIANGERDSESLEDFPYGSSVTYRCDPDYFLTGAATIHCLSSGTWDQSVPHCKSRQHSTSIPLSEIQCQQPTKIQNGDHSHQELSVFTSGMSVNYTCEPGYSLRGEATIYCTPSGKWSAPAPHCKMIQCPSPPNVQHGNYSAPESIQYTNGKSVNFSCQPGYVLIGEATLNCTASGVWSLPVPHCEVGCILPQISGGKKENSEIVIQIGANVTLECEDGYVLKGSSRVQCQPDFTWDPPVPVCNQGFYISVATGIGSLVGALLLLVIAGVFCVIVIVLKRNKAKYTPASNRIYESPDLQVA